jgi:hypothetical protein
MLKLIVDFGTLLIGVEGAKLLRKDGTGETPQERSDEEAVSTREPLAPGAEINRHV